MEYFILCHSFIEYITFIDFARPLEITFKFKLSLDNNIHEDTKIYRYIEELYAFLKALV